MQQVVSLGCTVQCLACASYENEVWLKPQAQSNLHHRLLHLQGEESLDLSYQSRSRHIVPARGLSLGASWDSLWRRDDGVSCADRDHGGQCSRDTGQHEAEIRVNGQCLARASYWGRNKEEVVCVEDHDARWKRRREQEREGKGKEEMVGSKVREVDTGPWGSCDGT